MNITSQIFRLVAVVLMVMLVSANVATAKKPPKPGDGGGEPTAAELNPAIAFVSTQTSGRNAGRQDVIVASADLASEVNLTETLQWKQKGAFVYDLGSPAWSSGGGYVAFWAQDWSNPDAVRTQLYAAKADGSQLTLVRDFASRPHVRGRPGFTCDGLNFSPTGRELIYAGYHAVVAVDVATGELRILLEGFSTGDPVDQPALSPDLDPASGYQGMLAVVGLDGSVDADGSLQSDIYMAPLTADDDGYLLPVDPASISNVTNGAGTNEFHPSWSPDGQKLACFHDDGVDEWLTVIDMPTGQVHLIWPDYGTVVCGEDRATWTSDGLDLVYRTDFSGIPASDLTIIRSDGTAGPANYTNTSAFAERGPAWNPAWDPFGPGI